jgi:hypothetical protein
VEPTEDELERRHAALVARDREIGLEAEADAARAHASRLQRQLDLATERLARKNARIAHLRARVTELEQRAPVGRPTLGGALSRLTGGG